MKKILLIICPILILFSCRFGNTIKGNGKTATEVRSFGNANKISVSGIYEVELNYGEKNEIKVEADENLLPYIVTVVEGDKLSIKTQEGSSISTFNPMKLVVTIKEINSISVSGSCRVIGNDKFSIANKLDLHISGAGVIQLQVNTPNVNAKISGSATIELQGETQNNSVSISGSGTYKSKNLKAENVDINVSGSGNAYVYADNLLNASISGSGSVKYTGNAKIIQSISGSGSLSKME